jgi:Zn-finger nucleic acid-binding protein
MHCPVCRQPPLAPTQLENGLAGLGCRDCGGVLVPVLAARQWAETEGADGWSGHVEALALDDSSSALNCPKCGHFMCKFRIDAGIDYRLDLCGHCGEFWLDAGEWNLLGALELRQRLPAIFSQPWQLEIRQRESQAERETRLRAALGDGDYARVAEFARWLRAHPQAAQIRRHLGLQG